MLPRVIPCLLLKNAGFVKTVRFREPKYLGDPLNILRIFNEKEVDEILILDILASRERRGPRLEQLRELATECFMPVGYGGGLTTLGEIEAVLMSGFEKIALNSVLATRPELVTEAATAFGSQSVVASLDVKKGFLGRYEVYVRAGTERLKRDPVSVAKEMESRGAGEVFLNAIDRDGTMSGYDLKLLHEVSSAVSIPVVACGGAAGLDDFEKGVREGGASAVAAGSLFVFQGPHRAVLINGPQYKDIKARFAPPSPSPT